MCTCLLTSTHWLSFGLWQQTWWHLCEACVDCCPIFVCFSCLLKGQLNGSQFLMRPKAFLCGTAAMAIVWKFKIYLVVKSYFPENVNNSTLYYSLGTYWKTYVLKCTFCKLKMDLISIVLECFSVWFRKFLLIHNISINNKTAKYRTVVDGGAINIPSSEIYKKRFLINTLFSVTRNSELLFQRKSASK